MSLSHSPSCSWFLSSRFFTSLLVYRVFHSHVLLKRKTTRESPWASAFHPIFHWIGLGRNHQGAYTLKPKPVRSLSCGVRSLSSSDGFATQDSFSSCQVAALLAFLCSLEVFELAFCAPGFQTRLWLQVCDAYRNQDVRWDFSSLPSYLSVFPNLGTVTHVKSSGVLPDCPSRPASTNLAPTSHISPFGAAA